MMGGTPSFCRPDGEACDTTLAVTGATFSDLFQPSGTEGRAQASVHRIKSDMEASICAQLGWKPGSLRD